MLAARWGLSVLMLTVGVVYTLHNLVHILRWARDRTKRGLAPFVGGLSGAGGLALIPVPALNGWWPLPLFLDVGCVPVLLWILVYLLWRSFKTKSLSDRGR